MSKIQLTGDHLMYWDEYMSEGDDINTFKAMIHSEYPYSASGGMYSTGVDEHTDDHVIRSALLIVHNEGFVIRQEGVEDNQPPGTRGLIIEAAKAHGCDKVL